MENEDKRKNDPLIDEDYLMSIMAGGDKGKAPERETSKEGIQPKQVQKEKGRPRKVANEVDYEEFFFRNPDTNARNGKSVYIRPEFHERLSRIVQVIGEDKLTLYAYLDNVLLYHFQEFSEQITASFNEKYKPIL